VQGTFKRQSLEDAASIEVSVDNGLDWEEVWTATGIGVVEAQLKLLKEVSGAYEVLLKVKLRVNTSTANACLRAIEIESTTMLNAKTQPRLNLGRNTVYVGAGEQTESLVLWPELQGGNYKKQIIEERNIASTLKHPGYLGTVYPAVAGEDAYLVYRLDAPRDITRVQYGGRFCNRARGSHVDLLFSLDGGQTWGKSWSLRRTTPPWDVLHYESVEVPSGHRSVWVKYLLNSPEAAPSGCSIYAVRMEADYRPADAERRPVRVKFNWSERHQDRSLVERSHTQTIAQFPFKYIIDVGGEDHPIVRWWNGATPRPSHSSRSNTSSMSAAKTIRSSIGCV
jgi:hypothetical protein